MAGGLCGYPPFGGLLMNECFTLAETKLNSRGHLRKPIVLSPTNKMKTIACSYDLYIPHIVTL